MSETFYYASVLKAISNKNRLQILFNLLNKELSVGEIENTLNLSQSALSQHLAILRKEGIVKTRRKSQLIYYSIKNPKITKLLIFLQKLF